MSDDHSPEAIRKHVRTYLFVFGALILGTILTVWAAQMHFGSEALNIAIGLAIATVKATLVAGYFMHLFSEKTAIYAMLAFTVFFATGMMVLTLWASRDLPFNSFHF